MTVGKLCTKEVASATPETTVEEAARQMRHHHVGDLVVVKKGRPIGVVTDRDIVISVVATGLDAAVFTLGDLVLKQPITCSPDLDVSECLQQMRTHGVRRMPVVNKSGMLVGILTLDDLLRHLAGEMGDVAKLIGREQAVEVKTRV